MNRDVLVVAPTLAVGGAERHSVWLAVHAAAHGWRPHVLAFGDGPLRHELTAAAIPVEVLPVSGPGRVRAGADAVGRALRRIRPALVTAQHIAADSGVRLARHRMRPAERPPYLVWKHTYGNPGYRGRRERLFERLTGTAVTRYGAVCHTQVRHLVDDLGIPSTKIAVLPNAVPVPAAAPPPPPPGPPSVLMAAALRADKDHALVLRAWPAVLARHPHARLRLAGDGPLRERLRRQAAELGIAERVEFLGVRADVPALLSRAHLLVLASYAVECFPYAVLEAMAAARGVIATGIAGLPELVDDGVTGRLVPPRDPDALADALLAGLAGPTAGAWGRAGWARAASVFPLPRWSDGVHALLSEVAAR